MSSVGTPPGSVPAGNFTSSTHTNAAHPVDGRASDGTARIVSARSTPTADIALRGNYAPGQEPASIGPNRPLFSQAAPPFRRKPERAARRARIASAKTIPDSGFRIPRCPSAGNLCSALAAAGVRSCSTRSPTSPREYHRRREDSPYPDLGPHPFMSNPTGTGPNGSFGFQSRVLPHGTDCDQNRRYARG